LAGCALYWLAPEPNPDQYAARAVDRSWVPPRPLPSYAPAATTAAQLPAPPAPRDEHGALYSLAELIDLALTHNPAAREAWEQARTSAPAWTVSRGGYHPQLFGGRRADTAQVLAQLPASDVTFNRRIQAVVFDTQRCFYGLAAARAVQTVPKQNLESARTDDGAVAKRVALGLAIQPKLLLSRRRVARAQYDVANSELLCRRRPTWHWCSA
jgi:outer membrane protein TolC